MASSNPSSNSNEMRAFEFFPLTPDLSPVPTIVQLQQQLHAANREVVALKQQLAGVKAQMLVSVEESVMVAEAHLEQRLEQKMEELEERMIIKLDKETDVRVKVELVFVTTFVMLLSLFAGVILRVFGY